jgi:AmmeMemoRadiSam system protein A
MNGPLNDKQQRTLLELARAQVESYVRANHLLTIERGDPRIDDTLAADGACFVTLKNRGALRGCIGTIVAHEPLYRSVLSNAVAACTDPRFQRNPITPDELDRIDVEISVLGPLQRVANANEVVVGRDGIILSFGHARGVFLPQVPVEQGWDRQEYLRQIGRKAGLSLDAWKDPGAVLETFTAQVFGERSLGPA